MEPSIPEYQHKPKKSLSYKAKAKLGLIKAKSRKKPLRKISKARAKDTNDYVAKASDWLFGETCALCQQTEHLSVHHRRGRSGPLLLDETEWVALCLIGSERYLKQTYPDSNHSYSGGCHGWVEANRALAIELGLTAN